MSLARLTAPQALEIGASVLTEAAGRPVEGGPAQDGTGRARVVVTTDGRALPAPDGAATAPALAAVLADLGGAARPRREDPVGEPLLAELDRAAAELPATGLPRVAVRLGEAAAGIDRIAVRAELAALVRAVEGRAVAAGGNGGGPAPPTPARRGPGRPAGSTRRRVGAWLLSVVVLAVVVLIEVLVLRDDVATDIGLLLDAGREGSAPSAAPTADAGEVKAPAPAAAGAVSAVDLRRLAACQPGRPCTVRLQVQLVPGTGPQTVSWSYRFVDRCTRRVAPSGPTSAPGGTLTVPAGSGRAVAVATVPLPPLPAVAVFAVTERPATAASAPVLLGSCSSGRPAG